jgi:hypothetical protein
MLPAIFKGNPEIVIRKKEVFLSSRHSEGVNPRRRCPERSEGTLKSKNLFSEKRRRFFPFASLRVRMTEKESMDVRS